MKVATTMNLLIPALLTERGRASNQIYRAPINHRQIDYFVLNNRHKNGRAVKHSFTNPTGEEAFDSLPMVLFPHCLRCTDKHVPNECQMTSQKSMRLPPELGVIGARTGVLDGIEIDLARNSDFRRLLEIFGYQWHDEDGNIDTSSEPSVMDFLSFFDEFKGINVSTQEGFKLFLRDFGLEDLYEYDDTVDVLLNMNRFGWLLRSLTNIRFSPSDGQHRWWCFSSLIQGFPDATNTLPLPFRKFHEFDLKLKPLKNWQIHQSKTVTLIGLKDETITPQAVAEFVRYSREIFVSQSILVDWSYFNFTCMMCNKIGSDLWETDNFKDMNFENYWDWSVKPSDAIITKNHIEVWNAIKNVIDSDGQLQKEAKLCGDPKKWSTSKESIDGYVKSTGIRVRHAKGFNQYLKALVNTLKAFCDRSLSFMILPDLAEKTEWDDQRMENIHEWIHTFHSFEFLNSIYKIVAQAIHYIEVRLWVEQKLLLIFRKNYIPFKDKIRAGTPINPLLLPKDEVAAKNFVFPKYESRLKRTAVGSLLKTSGALQKALESVSCLVYQNIFTTILEKGYDFKLFSDEVMDHFNSVVEDPKVAKVFFEDDEEHNFCLKYYLSKEGEELPQFEFVEIDTTLPGAVLPNQKMAAKKNKNDDGDPEPKFMISILLQLYPYYVKIRKEPFAVKLDFFLPYFGKFSSDRNAVVNGIDLGEKTHGFNPEIFDNEQKPKPTDLQAFNRGNLLFSDFIDELQNGSFDADMIEPFRLFINDESELDFLTDYASKIERKKKAVSIEVLPVEDELGNTKVAAETPTAAAGAAAKDDGKGAETAGAPAPAPVIASTSREKNPHTAFTRYVQNHQPPARDLITALARLAVNYQNIDVDSFFSVTFNREALSKFNFKDKNHNIVWNQAMSDLGADLPKPADGLGQTAELLPITWNEKCCVFPRQQSDRQLRPTTINPARKVLEFGETETRPRKCSNENCNEESVLDEGEEVPEPDILCPKCKINWFHHGCGKVVVIKKKDTVICLSCRTKTFPRTNKGQTTPGSTASNTSTPAPTPASVPASAPTPTPASADSEIEEETEVVLHPDNDNDNSKSDENQTNETVMIGPMPKPPSSESDDSTDSEEDKEKDEVISEKCCNPNCNMESEYVMKISQNLCDNCKTNYTHRECLIRGNDGKLMCFVCDKKKKKKRKTSTGTSPNSTKKNRTGNTPPGTKPGRGKGGRGGQKGRGSRRNK